MNSIIDRKIEAHLLRTLLSEKISQKWKEKLSIDVGFSFRNLGKIHHWKCPISGLEWYTPKNAAGEPQLYEQLEKIDWYYMADKWEFTQALRYLKKDSNVLEIGSGSGHFLQIAQKSGIKASGVELNQEAADKTRSLGFDIYTNDLNHLSETLSFQFDAICAFQVLEHVPEPLEFITNCLRLLKPKGKLILSVPDSTFMRKVDPDNLELTDQPPHHMSHWKKEVFEALENVLPLRIYAILREPLQPYHVRWYVTARARNTWKHYLPYDKTNLYRYLFNHFSTYPAQLLIKIFLLNSIPGHTLFTVLELKE